MEDAEEKIRRGRDRERHSEKNERKETDSGRREIRDGESKSSEWRLRRDESQRERKRPH